MPLLSLIRSKYKYNPKQLVLYSEAQHRAQGSGERYKMKHKVILIGIGLAALWWISESSIHAFLFHEGTLIEQIFSPAPHELWIRSLVGGILILLSIIVNKYIKRKRSEQQQREGKERLKTILDSIQSGILIIDAESHKIVDINPAAIEMVGVPKGQIIGQVCHKFVCPAEKGKCPITDLGQKVDNSERVLLRADGRDVPILKTAVPVTLDGRECFIENITDITERKEAEEKIKKYAEELEQSNHLKGLFTDILRHDLLNPTGVIRNIAEIMEYDEKLKGSRELEVIKRNVIKLEDIIQNASQYARLESEEALEKTEINITELIENIIDDLHHYAAERKMKVEFKPGEVHKANASGAIESVFVNILSNAIKYSPEGTDIKVTIEDDGKNKRISFIDQGDGILDENKETVFDRFTRKDKKGVKGTGLGLAITKRIVDLHKGKIWAEDNPEGKGSVFIVEIPK